MQMADLLTITVTSIQPSFPAPKQQAFARSAML